MRIKSYYAQTIPEAMERARVELGAEAMIIASNKTSGDTQRLGTYEVVFGVADQGSRPEARAGRDANSAPSHRRDWNASRSGWRTSESRSRTNATRCSPAKATNSAKTANEPIACSRSNRISADACG